MAISSVFSCWFVFIVILVLAAKFAVIGLGTGSGGPWVAPTSFSYGQQ